MLIKDSLNKEKWTFIAPVSGVILTDSIKKEFKINKVLLVSKDKIPRIRKRIGLSEKLSELQSWFGKSAETLFISSPETLAIIRESGNLEEVKKKCVGIIKDELALLALSQLGYSKRRTNSNITIERNKSNSFIETVLIKSDGQRKNRSAKVMNKTENLFLDGGWRHYNSQVFFLKLLKIISKKIFVEESWRKEILRASILAGQSQLSREVAHAFLWNMIAIEILLTKQGDKYREVLPQRIEAFIGWSEEWKRNNYEARIGEVYQKRCNFVHDGKREEITNKDLFFTDDILLNIFTNIVGHTSIFVSKDSLIEFVKKIEAGRLLGIKSKVMPKSLQFISRTYRNEDFEEI